MFIQQAFKGFNQWWRYILVVLVVFAGYNIGSAPLTMALYRAKAKHPDLANVDIQEFFVNSDFSQFYINKNLGLTLLLLLFVAALATFYFIFKPMHKREFKTLTRATGRLDWSKIFYAFLFWLGLSLCFEGILYSITPENYSFNLQLNTFLPLLALCILILPIQTSFEELFFRGYLMQGIGITQVNYVLCTIGTGILTYLLYKMTNGAMMSTDLSELMHTVMSLVIFFFYFIFFIGITSVCVNYVGKIQSKKEAHNYNFIPLIVTSVLFGLVHSANPEIEKFGFGIMQAYYISAGLFLGILTIMDDRLELAIGVHAATNFTGAVFVGYDGGAITTDSMFVSHALNPTHMLIGFYVMASIFLIVTKLKYQWPAFTRLIDPIYKPDEDVVLQELIEKSDTI